MKLQRLRLLAFGHFSQVDLDFSAAPAVHLVYGRNEAGKSTALRAIRGLFYGIPVNTNDAHMHKMNELLVGATVSNNGTSLDILRRKGAKNTLLDAESGNAISEVALRGMLGGVDEATFGAMFGLDHESLRSGAEALLRGGGSVGEGLFDAGVGGRGIQQVLGELNREAEELYKPRGKRQRINETLRAVKASRDARRAASVRPEAWVLQVEALESCRKQLAEASARRADLRAEQSSLQRARRVLPMLAKRRTWLKKREQLGAVVDLDAQVTARRQRAQRGQEEVERDRLRLRSEIEERVERLEALEIDDEIAGIGPGFMDDFTSRLGSYRKALADLPKRKAELGVLEDEVQRLAQAIGRENVASDDWQVDVREQSLVRRLATERAALDASLTDCRRRLDEESRELEELESQLEGVEEVPDLELLRDSLDRQREVGSYPARIEELEREVKRLRAEVRESMRALRPWKGGRRHPASHASAFAGEC